MRWARCRSANGSRRRRVVAVAAAAVPIVLGGCGGGEPGERPNILLVTIDTLRADHLGSYGYERRTDPNLTRLAASGVRFEHAVSQAPWTLPSVATIHTALYPSQHGAVGAETRLADEVRTLAEVLRAEGYATLGVVSHKFVDTRHGLAQGFDVFDESQILGDDAVTSRGLTETALDALAEATEPFFLWVHYFDPHFTYVRHPELGFADGYHGRLPESLTADRLDRELRASIAQGRPMDDADLRYVQAVYDEEVAHTDRWLGELHAGLDASGLGGRTVSIVTADHGEYFLERGRFFHGRDVYEPLVHVPLVVSGAIDPAARGVTVAAPVEIRHIPATVMDLAGVSEHPFAGVNLLELVRGGAGAPVFMEGSHAFGTDERKQAVLYRGWKLIRNLDDDSLELYHLPSDPAERNDRWRVASRSAAGPAVELRRLLAELDELPAGQPAALKLTAEERRQLEALGYVDGGP